MAGMTGVKIGLALGGGAARGWAHIGVLQALQRAGIKPDIIAGTSIGAVVGGCFAAGHLDNLEVWARELTPKRVFGYLDFNLAGTGLISGQRLCERLELHLGDRNIEDLNTRFTAVATEVGTGHEHWLSRGRLVDAVRASYALPGVFKPVKINGRWLFDGALVNPIPVSVCRALGARYVIAVNLNFDILGRGSVISTPEALLRRRGRSTERRRRDEAGEERCSRSSSPPVLWPRRRRTRHFNRNGRCLQYRPGPHRPLAAGRRPARRDDISSASGYRAFRLPSRRRSHPARRQRCRASA